MDRDCGKRNKFKLRTMFSSYQAISLSQNGAVFFWCVIENHKQSIQVTVSRLFFIFSREGAYEFFTSESQTSLRDGSEMVQRWFRVVSE